MDYKMLFVDMIVECDYSMLSFIFYNFTIFLKFL